MQSADTTKTRPNAKLQNAPTFTGNRSHSHVCLLLVIKIKTYTYQLCKRQSADTNVLIGRYRLSADYQCISNYYYYTKAVPWLGTVTVSPRLMVMIVLLVASISFQACGIFLIHRAYYYLAITNSILVVMTGVYVNNWSKIVTCF